LRTFHCRPGKSAFAALFLVALAFFLGKMWWANGSLPLLVLAAFLVAGAAKGAADALNTEPVLKFNSRALWIRTGFGSMQEIPWSEVQGISLEVLTLRYAGLVPMGRTEYLVIACAGGMFGTKRFRLTVGTIELPPGGTAELVMTLQAAHVDAVGAAAVAMAGAGPSGWGAARPRELEEQSTAGFDPDAAIARHLAAKRAARAQAPAAPAHPVMPHRPVFGRRTS